MAAGYLKCVEARMNDMFLPFKAEWFTTTALFVNFLKNASSVLKKFPKATVGEAIDILLKESKTAGFATAEVALTEVLALTFSFYFGALSGAFLICTAERLFKGPDDYTPKLSMHQMKHQFRNKVKQDMPPSVEDMVAQFPEMRGAAPNETYGTRYQYYGYGQSVSDSSETGYA
jgi:hypothetical protein